MLERFYVRPDTVDRTRLSWIHEPIEQYVKWLAERDYSDKTVLRRVPLLVSFGEHAKTEGASSFAHLPLHGESFVTILAKATCKRTQISRAKKKDHSRCSDPDSADAQRDIA